jgi:hypothetical protein
LDDNCKKLIDLINKCHVKLEQFAHMNKDGAVVTGAAASGDGRASPRPLSPNTTEVAPHSPHKFSSEDVQLKNVIVSNLVSYSYDIAHTVKRIVCIMGHSENTNL